MEYAVETVELRKLFYPQRRLSRPFRCGKPIIALEDVNLRIGHGELLALLGPNGAGKTTLLKLLSTLILPTSGTAFVNGFNIIDEEDKVKSSLGLVTGEPRSLYWRLTGRQNLEFFASLYNLSHSLARRRIGELLELLGIGKESEERCKNYSTGTMQRFFIARGLLNDPKILLMDEPTKSLDPTAAQNLRIFIRDRLAKERGKTILFTTHQLEEAAMLSDRIAILDGGRIKGCGTMEELQRKVGSPGASLGEIYRKLTGG